MSIWLVMQDDGNVCCPSAEVRAVCTTEEIAEQFIVRNPSSYEQCVVEWSANKYIGANEP